MDSDDAFGVHQLTDIFPPMEDNIDSWINQATWYDLECINHYDQQPPLTCAVNSTLNSVPPMTVNSTMQTVNPAIPKTHELNNTSPANVSDILNGLQTMLKENDVLDVLPEGQNNLKAALAVSNSGIMNGIFIPSTLIPPTLTPKICKDTEAPVTSSATSTVDFRNHEEELVHFLQTEDGRIVLGKVLGVSKEELLTFLTQRSVKSEQSEQKDFHCPGCQCNFQSAKESEMITDGITQVHTPTIADNIPRSPEVIKATSPDSSSVLSPDSLSTSPFDNHLAASPEIPIIKRELVDYTDKHDITPSESAGLSTTGEKVRRHRGTYPKSICLDVIEFVKQGFSARAAAKKFGIPKSTVHNWLHEDIATRPEKGHRKRAATHTPNIDIPRSKSKPDMNELLPTYQDVCSNHQYHPEDGEKYVLTLEVPRKRTSESFSSEDMEPPSVAASQASISPVPVSPRDPSVISPSNDVSLSQTQADVKVEGEVDLSCDFDELLHIDDWIEQEEWYRQQYLKHYGAPSRLRKTYGSYSSSQRKAAVDFVRQGNTISTAARKFGIPKSTIHTWLTEESAPYVLPPEMENEIINKMDEIQKNNGSCYLKLGLLKKVAQDTAGSLVPNFRASYPWCRDFIKRHDLYLFDSKENLDKLCQEEETDTSQPPSMVDFTSFLGLKPTNDVRQSTTSSS